MDQAVAKADAKFAGWRALKTLALGLTIVLAVIFPKLVIPAEFFMKVEELTLCPAGVENDKCAGFDHDVVRKKRSPRWPLRMEWAAIVYRVHVFRVTNESQTEVLDAVCRGSGEWNYRPTTEPQYLDLSVWIGQPCHLHPGARYIPYVQWTLRWGIWTWTVDHMGEPALVPARGSL